MLQRLLSYPQLKIEKGIPFTQRHLQREVDAGKFPRPVPIGERLVAWLEAEVDTWIAERAAMREPGAVT